MLKRLSAREMLEQLAADWEPQIRAAWLASLADISSSIVITRVIERLERNDVAGAVQMLNIREEMFARVEGAIIQAYNAGGLATVNNMPRLMDPEGNRVVLTWGVRNLQGEQELRQHAAQAVRGIATDMRAGIAETLSESLSRGDNPTRAVRQIVGTGKINPLTGTRMGGNLGLTQRQMQTTAWIRRAMAEGDTAKMRAYLDLSPAIRGRRYFDTVTKAIAEGKAFTVESANKIADTYAERALDYRGRQLALHETRIALDKSRDDAFAQQITEGKLDQQDVTATWFHTKRKNQRDQHAAMDGQTIAYGESFIAPDGTMIRYPHDPDAPIEHTIGCWCRVEYKIDYAGRAARRYRDEQV